MGRRGGRGRRWAKQTGGFLRAQEVKDFQRENCRFFQKKKGLKDPKRKFLNNLLQKFNDFAWAVTFG